MAGLDEGGVPTLEQPRGSKLIIHPILQALTRFFGVSLATSHARKGKRDKKHHEKLFGHTVIL